MGFPQRLSAEFYADVQQDVRNRLAGAGLVAGVFDDPDDVAYLTGFFHFPNERPVAVWLPADGDDPDAGATTTARLAALQEAFAGVPFHRTAVVGDARLVKREPEIALHREAGRITDLMLEAGRALVEEALRSGGALPTEAELAGSVTRAGTSAMYAEHDDVVVVPHLAGGLVYSGPNSARPHALPSGHPLRPGEVFMLSLGAGVGGRHVESERTFILGAPTAEQERYYSTVLAAQQTGLAGLRAGRRCADVNAECLAVIREAGLSHLLRHRQGHGIGLNIHEPPWLEDGDPTELRANMVVSDEPGLYVPGHGGYRISDSVLVGPGGGEPLTFYPKNLDDIVVAA